MEKLCHLGEDTQGWPNLSAKNGQALPPMLELTEQSQAAVDEVINVVGRERIEAVLRLLAEQMAGPTHLREERPTVG